MSRQILAYDDFDDPHGTPTPPPPSHIPDGRGLAQRAPANNGAFGGGTEEISSGRHVGFAKKGKQEKKKQKQLQKQLQQAAVKSEAGEAGASDEENARKRKKRKFEESLEHDRVHWDAQGQREYGTVEVKYDDDAEVDDPTSLNPPAAPGGSGPSRPQLTFEDTLNSMFEDAEKDISGSDANAEESNTTGTQQAKHKKVDHPKGTVSNKAAASASSGGASASSSKPGAGFKKEDKGKGVQKATADTAGLLMDADAWDDSVLIDAWDAAMEEYQILNGPEADWKKDPVHKDSIWYKSSHANIQWQDVKPAASKNNLAKPTLPPGSTSNAEANAYDEDDRQMEDGEEEQEQASAETGASQAAVPGASAAANQEHQAIANLPAAFDISKMTKDELFQKAVEASYWAGYWAAAYHASNGPHADVET